MDLDALRKAKFDRDVDQAGREVSEDSPRMGMDGQAPWGPHGLPVPPPLSAPEISRLLLERQSEGRMEGWEQGRDQAWREAHALMQEEGERHRRGLESEGRSWVLVTLECVRGELNAILDGADPSPAVEDLRDRLAVLSETVEREDLEARGLAPERDRARAGRRR